MSRQGIKYRVLTFDRLKSVLSYDQKSGLFRWKVANSNRIKIGRRAGNVAAIGRRIIRIDGHNYHANVLAWFYVHGKWPINDIDHKDLNKSNDAIHNLREATRSQNMANGPLRKDNKSGFKGVQKIKYKKFIAYIKKNKKQFIIGTFNSAKKAHSAYVIEATNIYGEFARGA